MSEKYSSRVEKGTEALENAAAERAVELNRQLDNKEKPSEKEQKATLEKARTEANTEALFSKEYSSERKHPSGDDESSTVITSSRRAQAYKKTMREIQKDMKPNERAFSKVIHNPIVERASEITGSTIARPNAILYGSICAFLGVMAIYMYARYIGFALSGFETIAAFIIGWVIGLLIDFFRVMISGKRQ